MKKIILILILIISSFSKTIVVDKNVGCIWMPWIGFVCTGTPCDSDYDIKRNTISNALLSATNGDIIKICPGKYEESYLIVNKDITIKSTKSTHIDDVIVEDNSRKDIFHIKGWRSNIEFNFFTINQKRNNKNAIKIDSGSNFSFKNLKIISQGKGINQKGGSFLNSTFENITINAKKDGIYLKNPANINLYDVNITSIKANGLYFHRPQGDINIDKKNKINYISSREKGVYIGNSSQNYIIKHFNIHSSNSQGIRVKKDTTLTISNGVITTDNYSGIRVDTSNNDIHISDVNVTISGNNNKAIYIKSVNKLYLENSILEGAKYGFYLENSSNGGEIKNNIFKNASEKGLFIFTNKKWRGYQVTNNCFENGSGKNILSRDRNGYFNQNYYDDWSGSGSYIIPNIPKYDNFPVSSCVLEDNNNLVVEYRMDECEWNGNIKDNSGNNHSATPYNEVNTTSGKICKGGIFIDTKHQYLKTSGSGISPKNGNLSVSLWFKWNGGGEEVLYDKEYSFITKIKNGEIYINWSPRLGWTNTHIRINDENWHHLVITSEYDNTHNRTIRKYFFDGQYIGVDRQNGKMQDSNYDLIVGARYSYGSYGYYFNGYIDEFKVFNKVLNSSEILNMYNNENSGLNYDGSTRVCNNCNGGYLFRVKQLDRVDNNITTKIVNKNFNLKLYTDTPFSGTVCSAIIDNNGNNISNWIKNSFSNQTEKTNTYKATKANKDSRIKIEWLKNTDASCPLVNETNHTVSSDNFAIRPKNFEIEFSSSKIYAGGDFIITFKVLDENGNETKNYNETNSFEVNVTENKAGCKTGILEINVNFLNGKSESVAKYSEIGDINISIRDLNFANVDIDDTSLNDRVITPYTITIKSYPYDSNITSIFSNNSIIYIDKNLSRYAKLNTIIQMVNKQGDILENFDSNCYADDVNLTFSVNDNIVDSFIGMYNINGIDENDSQFQKWDSNFEIDSNLFNKGEANLTIKFNIYKNKSYPVSIVDLNFTKVTLDYLKAPIHKEKSLNKNLSFYYLRVVADDITTTETNSLGKVYILVYDRNRNHFSDEKLLYWFLDTNYNEDDVKILGYTSGFKYDENVTNLQVSLDKITYDYNLSVENLGNITFGVIHYKTPTYLWYSRYKEYNDSLNSHCLTHYCSEYIYKSKNIMTKSIGSGKFQGSEVNITRPKRKKFGIKMYR